MFKSIITTAILLAAIGVQAEWSMLPVTEATYKPDPIVSLKVGSLKSTHANSEALTTTGVEANFECPLLKGTAPIRQQLSYNRGEESGATTSTIEVNPHYMVNLAENLNLGFGPGFGVIMMDAPGLSKNIGALQLGTSIQYLTGPLYAGAEVRYQYTEQVAFGTEKGINNTMTSAKVGYKF
jgi:hypothetical protein